MKRGKKGAAFAAGAAAAAAMTAWAAWENRALTVQSISATETNLPQAFSGFRIAHISDFHNEEFGGGNEKPLRLLKKISPDIVVITGDLIDSRHTEVEISADFVRRISAFAPVYYVPGNHESRIPEAYRSLKAMLAETGVCVLENDAQYIERDGERIQIIGVRDPDFYTPENPENPKGSWDPGFSGGERLLIETNDLRDSGVFSILLSHRPEFFDFYVRSGVDLVFAGHAHGGQFRIPFAGGLFAPGQGFFPKYDAGLYREGNTSMIVSRGMGRSLGPLRLHNRPEIIAAQLVRSG